MIKFRKILALNDLKLKLDQLRGSKIGLCHGCFDMFHYGHLLHLKAASDLCDVLIVTITADIFVNKGPDRPVYSEYQRAAIISSLDFVDFVAINNNDSALNLISELAPNFLIKGSDYISGSYNKNFNLEKEAIKRCGGDVVFTDEWTTSTSNIIAKIRA